MERVLLNITSEQFAENEDNGEVNFITEGCRHIDEHRITFSYIESELIGMPGHTTAITIDGDKIVMERKGAFKSRFEFETGKQFVGNYATPLGDMCLKILPIRAYHNGSDLGGEVELIYEIIMQQERYSNKYNLKYKYLN